MAFKELSEFLESKPIEIPIRGKVYSFPGEVSGRAWLLLQRMGAAFQDAQAALAEGRHFEMDAEVLSDAEKVDLDAELFGGVDKEMSADGCTSSELKLVYGTLVIYHMAGAEAAEAFWEARGEVPAPNRAARRRRTAAK